MKLKIIPPPSHIKSSRLLARFQSSLPLIDDLFIPKENKDPKHNEKLFGGIKTPTTQKLNIFDPLISPKWPVYRILDHDGSLIDGSVDPNIDPKISKKILKTMIKLKVMDQILYSAQRQGRISFYMTSSGEEATQIGSAAALDDSDMVFAQYREPGLLLWRNFTLQNIADQCFSNLNDLGKGRQMPVHYGSNKHFYQTVSSPLATQIPQAVGAAYACKLKGSNQVPVCFFGDGAASEGDFHAAMNFASTLECPIIFICRNNGYAISTPSKDQFRGDGIISRAPGYGMLGIRVDGNDLLAVYSATKRAREVALKKNRPILIEAMTYRVGHHSTSDDWMRYRDEKEVKMWENEEDPLPRFSKYLINQGICSSKFIEDFMIEEKTEVIEAIKQAEAKAKPCLTTMFHDVYKNMPKNLIEQQENLFSHVKKYPETYPDIHEIRQEW
mmetsp:Transcript_10917/g.15514  ORF Transcript_10917/g.15514 Transcript_10917/m.15514 type:complete len:442 (+) Transcript_10917:32-1357(+)